MACHCTITSTIERQIFKGADSTFARLMEAAANAGKTTRPNMDVPDEVCPICLVQLRQKPPAKCCGRYPKRLNCGHWVHVCCQVDAMVLPHPCQMFLGQPDKYEQLRQEFGIDLEQFVRQHFDPIDAHATDEPWLREHYREAMNSLQ
jgi:hypothetical protein